VESPKLLEVNKTLVGQGEGGNELHDHNNLLLVLSTFPNQTVLVLEQIEQGVIRNAAGVWRNHIKAWFTWKVGCSGRGHEFEVPPIEKEEGGAWNLLR